MNRFHPGTSYRQVAIQTADPGRLVLMLYDGAINFLERALHGFEQADAVETMAAVYHNINSAQAILEELQRSLNIEQGGELADTMWRLYDYFNDLLHRSNANKDATGVREVMTRLSMLREAWAKMLQQQNGAIMGESPALVLSAVG